MDDVDSNIEKILLLFIEGQIFENLVVMVMEYDIILLKFYNEVLLFFVMECVGSEDIDLDVECKGFGIFVICVVVIEKLVKGGFVE